MNQERLIWKGQIQEQEENKRTLESEASGIIRTLRNNLNPMFDIRAMDVALIRQQAARMHEIYEELKKIDAKLKELDELLNG
jgi:hypothetical protein